MFNEAFPLEMVENHTGSSTHTPNTTSEKVSLFVKVICHEEKKTFAT